MLFPTLVISLNSNTPIGKSRGNHYSQLTVSVMIKLRDLFSQIRNKYKNSQSQVAVDMLIHKCQVGADVCMNRVKTDWKIAHFERDSTCCCE